VPQIRGYAEVRNNPFADINAKIENGHFIREQADQLGIARPTFAVADIGGIVFCCPDLRVIDLAGLGDRTIARDRSAKFLERILATKKPDFILKNLSSGKLRQVREEAFADYAVIRESRTKIIYVRADLLARANP
jgi:hypothetical protein